MRKIMFLLAFLPMFVFTACSSDDDESDYDVQALIGMWQLEEVDYGNGYEKPQGVSSVTTAIFNSDGTYSGQGLMGNGKGTYDFKGSKITCYVNGEVYITYTIISLQGENCELSVQYKYETFKIKCKKLW